MLEKLFEAAYIDEICSNGAASTSSFSFGMTKDRPDCRNSAERECREERKEKRTECRPCLLVQRRKKKLNSGYVNSGEVTRMTYLCIDPARRFKLKGTGAPSRDHRAL